MVRFRPKILRRDLRLGLRSQILISLAILMAAAILLIGLMGIKFSEMYILRQKIEQSRMLASFISFYLSQDEGVDNLKDVIEPFMGANGIRAILLLDKGENIILEMGETVEKLYSHNKEPNQRTDLAKEEIEILNDPWFDIGDKLFYAGPLMVRGSLYGRMRMILPMDDVKDDLIYVRKVIFFYALVYSIILVICGFFLLKRTVITPIRRLEESAKRIAKGNLNEVVKVERNDEIGGLAESFNRMTVTLVDKINALKKANKEVIEAQNQILRAERLASLGRLASGIAHEIGNPLGAIAGYIDVLIKGIDDKKEEMEILERTGQEIVRVREILRRLLDFSRPSEMRIKDVDINEIASQTMELLKVSLRNIDIKLNLDRDISPVRVDPGQLEQVLINLVLNSRDSMPEGGRLTITTGEEQRSRPSFFSQRRKTDPPDMDFTDRRQTPLLLKGFRRWVKITVSDTGCGIDEATLNMVFSPFFTTKEPGKGTGLGLSISLGIVQAFGGDIRVSSEPGKGSTFEVILPGID